MAMESSFSLVHFNLAKAKTMYLKNITCQLLCVLLWKHSGDFLELVFKEKKFEPLMRFIASVAVGLQEPYERKRVILGT
jgi:hypothetical protein